MAEAKSKVIIGLELDIANAIRNVQGIQDAIKKISLNPTKKEDLLGSFSTLEKEMVKASSTAAQGFKDSKEIDKFALGVGRLKNEFSSLTNKVKELEIDANSVEPQTKEFALYASKIEKAQEALSGLEARLTHLSSKQFKGAGADILGTAATGMASAARAGDKAGIEEISTSSLEAVNIKRQEAASLLENVTIAEQNYNITTEEGLKEAIALLDSLIERRREYWRLTRGSEAAFATLSPEQQADFAPVKGTSVESMQAQQVELRGNYKTLADLDESSSDIMKMQDTFSKITIEIEKQNTALAKNIDLKAKATGVARASTAEGLSAFSEDAAGVGLNLDAALGTTQQEAQRTQQLEETANAYGKIGDNIKRLTGFHAVFSFLKSVIRGVWQDVQQLDKQFNEIAIVTDYTTAEMWASFSKVNAIAQEYGVTTSNVISVQKLYYQQGKSTIEVNQLTGETLTLAKIAGLDYADATDKMTAALNAYNLEATSATMVTDTLSALAAQSAADTAEIANALTRTASIAANAGMGLQETTVWLTKMISTTREPAENLGTALKTIIARFSEIKDLSDEDLVLLGADFDFNKVEKALRSVDISLKDTVGQVRDVDDVFMDLSKVWDTLDRNTQRYIATNAAGSRQQSRFIAMISDYKETLRLTEVAQNSAGTGALQLATTMEGLETSVNNLKSAWQELYSNFMNSELFQTVLGWSTDILLGASEMSSALGALVALLIALKAVTLAVNTANLIKIAIDKQGVKTTLLNIFGIKSKTQSEVAAAAATGISTAATEIDTAAKKVSTAGTWDLFTAETALKGIQTLGVAVAIAAAVAIVAVGIARRNAANETKAAAVKAKEYNEALSEENKQTTALIETYNRFYRYRILNLRVMRLTAEEQDEYNDLTSYLAENLEGALDYYDEEGNAILKSNDALKEAIQAKEALTEETKRYTLQLEKQLALEQDVYTINSKAGRYLSGFSSRAQELSQAEEGSLAYQEVKNYAKSLGLSIEELQAVFADLSNSIFGRQQLGTLIGRPDLTTQQFGTFLKTFSTAIQEGANSQAAFTDSLKEIGITSNTTIDSLQDFNTRFGSVITNLASAIPSTLKELTVSSLQSQASYLYETKYPSGLRTVAQEASVKALTGLTSVRTSLNRTQASEYLLSMIEGKSSAEQMSWILENFSTDPEAFNMLMADIAPAYSWDYFYGTEVDKDDLWSAYPYSEEMRPKMIESARAERRRNAIIGSRNILPSGTLEKALTGPNVLSYLDAYSVAGKMETDFYDSSDLEEIAEAWASGMMNASEETVARINEIYGILAEGNVENVNGLVNELYRLYYEGRTGVKVAFGRNAEAKDYSIAMREAAANVAKEADLQRESLISQIEGVSSDFAYNFGINLEQFGLSTLDALKSVLDILTEGISDPDILKSIYSSVDSMIAAQPERADEIIQLLGQYGPELSSATGILKFNVALKTAGINTTEITKMTNALTEAYVRMVPSIEDTTETIISGTKEISNINKVISNLLKGGSIDDLSQLLNAEFMTVDLQRRLMEGIEVDASGAYKFRLDENDLTSGVLEDITKTLTGFYQDTVDVMVRFIEKEIQALIDKYDGDLSRFTATDLEQYNQYKSSLALYKNFVESAATQIKQDYIEAQKEAIREQVEIWKEYIDALKDIDIFSNLDGLIKSYEDRLSNIDTEQDLNLNVSRGQDLLSEEVGLITEAMAAEQVKYNRALKESAIYAEEIAKSKYGELDAQGRLIIDYKELADLANRIANASDDQKDSLQAEYDNIMDMVGGYEEMQDIVNETYSNTLAYAAGLRDIYKEELEYVVKVEERILQLLQERDDKALEAIKKRYDALKKADDDYLSVVRTNIEKERQLRDQASQYDELAKKEKKLNLLIAASGGKKTATIIALEKEVAETRQTLADQAVDDLITALEDEAEKRAETYDNEVAYQEEILSAKKDNMLAYNAEVKAIMSQNKNDIIATMKALDDEYIKGTSAAQEIWGLEWEKNITDAKIAMFALTDQNSPLVKAQETINEMQNSTIAFTNSLQSYTNELVGSIQTVAEAFDAAYSKAEALVAAYAKLIEQYQRLQSIGGGTSGGGEETSGGGFEEDYEEWVGSCHENGQMTDEEYEQWEKEGNALEWENYLKQLQQASVAISVEKGRLDSLYSNISSSEKNIAELWAYAKTSEVKNNPEKYLAVIDQIDSLEAYISRIRSSIPTQQVVISTAENNLEWLRNNPPPAYAKGGLVNYTGPAWVDGTPAEPEAFLSSKDTSNIAALTNVLDNIVSIPSPRATTIPQSAGSTTYHIEINVEELGEDYTVDNLYDDMEKKILDAASKGKVIQV